MAGYTRQSASAIVNGGVIDADDFNDEYNAIEAAFNASTGHTHDGTAGNGPPIENVGPGADLIVTAAELKGKTTNTLDIGTASVMFKDAYFDGTVNTDLLTVDETSTFTGNVTASADVSIGGNLTVTGDATINGNLTFGDGATDTLSFGADIDSNIIPETDDTYDLGSTTQEWRNLYIDGTAYVDAIEADTADIDGGTIDGAVIGGTTAAAITGTTITATSFVGPVTGNITGDVTGNVTGNLTGDVTGDVTGDETGDVTGNVTGNLTGNVTSTGANSFGSITTTGNATVGGDLTLTGNLTINGTTTTVNSTTLDIDDKNITIAADATTAVAANGAGFTINGAAATWTYNSTGDKFEMNKPLHVATLVGDLTGDVTGDVTGTVTGNVTGDITGDVTGNITGNVTGDVTGDVTGNITASSGDSTLNNLTINGTLDVTSTRITNVSDPTAAQDAATKAYVDSAIAGDGTQDISAGDIDATSLDLNGGDGSGWVIEQSGTSLVFKYNGTSKAKITNSGEIVAVDDVTAFGTI